MTEKKVKKFLHALATEWQELFAQMIQRIQRHCYEKGLEAGNATPTLEAVA